MQSSAPSKKAGSELGNCDSRGSVWVLQGELDPPAVSGRAQRLKGFFNYTNPKETFQGMKELRGCLKSFHSGSFTQL